MGDSLEPLASRSMRLEDYPAVVALWTASEGVEVAEGDGREDIARYLQRNPGLSRVVEVEGRVVAAVLCGHDGRRGLLYHLAVAPKFRGCGLGRRLVAESLAGLRRAGIPRALILVDKTNGEGQRFWEVLKFEAIADALPYGIDVF